MAFNPLNAPKVLFRFRSPKFFRINCSLNALAAMY